jgi:hypothetical protein
VAENYFSSARFTQSFDVIAGAFQSVIAFKLPGVLPTALQNRLRLQEIAEAGCDLSRGEFSSLD